MHFQHRNQSQDKTYQSKMDLDEKGAGENNALTLQKNDTPVDEITRFGSKVISFLTGGTSNE